MSTPAVLLALALAGVGVVVTSLGVRASEWLGTGGHADGACLAG